MSIQNKLSRLILPLAISPFLIGGSYAAWNYLSLQLNGSDVTQSIAQPETQFSDVASVPIGTFTYGGSTTWAPIRSKIDPLIQAAHPDFKLQYTEDDQASPG
ncbi:MAG: phosphate ABC transporter substrate-binding protein, partial [Cyanobacteria bacterium P01_A01_bin.135]